MKRFIWSASFLVALPLLSVTLMSTQAAPIAVGSKGGPSTVPIPAGIGGKWTLDPMHSRIGFVIRHVMINDIHGSFGDFSGNLDVNQKDFTKSSVNFTAKIASIDTKVAPRDAHLKSPDFFGAAKYPEMTFRSQRVMRSGNGFRVLGVFTMHGVSRSIIIPFTAKGPVKDGFGTTRAGVKARFDLNRQDYGVKWNQKLDNGGMALDDIVHVELDLEATKDGMTPKKPS